MDKVIEKVTDEDNKKKLLKGVSGAATGAAKIFAS
jgi:hypothetical protein